MPQIKNYLCCSKSCLILLKKASTMANPPPPQQSVPAPQPPNLHDPTINTTHPQSLQQPPTVPVLPPLPQAKISPLHLGVQVRSHGTPSSAAQLTALTLTPSVHAFAPAPSSHMSPQKQLRTNPYVKFESPSPQKALTDFSACKSDENSLHSVICHVDGRKKREQWSA